MPKPIAEIPFDMQEAPRRAERFAVEQRGEQFFQEAVQGGVVLASQRFTGTDEAAEAGRRFIAEQSGKGAEITGLSDVMLHVSGPGVKHVNVDAGIDEGRLIFDFHPDMPLADLERAAEKNGYFKAMVMKLVQFPDGTYGSVPYFVLKDEQDVVIPINAQYGFPLSTLKIESYVLVACDGTADIDIPALETHRSRNQALADLALRLGHGDEQGLMRRLHDLNGALLTGETDRPTMLRRVENLRQIGEVGREYVAADAETGESLIAVLQTMLHRGRPVSLMGEASTGPDQPLVACEANGLIVDILPAHPSLESAGPTIVLSCKAEYEVSETLCYMPLSRIRSLQF